MKPIKYIFFVLIISLTLSCKSSTTDIETVDDATAKVVIAYIHGWNTRWDTDTAWVNKITHINYAFANISQGEVIQGNQNDAATLSKIVALKLINPKLKILISVGGWSWSKHFSDAALTAASREIFAQSAVDFMLTHQLDGIDLDWEYPGLRGDNNGFRPEDKENFTLLLQQVREKLEALSPDTYLLTIATGAFQAYLDHTNMAEAHKSLDFVNIMTYDFYTGGGAQTGHHANLFASDLNPNGSSVAQAVNQHIAAGIPREKLVLGVPFYGRWWKDSDTISKGLYQVSSGARGTYSYRDIETLYTNKGGFNYYWDEAAKAPYLWNAQEKQFVTYENEQSLTHKLNYLAAEKLGGIMFWELSGDSGTLLHTIWNINTQ